MQRQVQWMFLTVQITVVVPQLQSIEVAVDISVVAQRQLPVVLFTAVNMQRQVPGVWATGAVFGGCPLTSGMSPRRLTAVSCRGLGVAGSLLPGDLAHVI